MWMLELKSSQISWILKNQHMYYTGILYTALTIYTKFDAHTKRYLKDH